MTGALEGGEWSAARPGRILPPGKDRVPILQEAGNTMYYIILYYIILYYIIPYHTKPNQSKPNQTTPHHITSHRIVSYHIIYHIISYIILYYILWDHRRICGPSWTETSPANHLESHTYITVSISLSELPHSSKSKPVTSVSKPLTCSYTKPRNQC